MVNGVETEQTKYCIDCKHLKHNMWCKRPQRVDIVTGEAEIKFASQERKAASYLLGEDPIDKCGPDAIFFEPKDFLIVKELWWKFWK